MKRFLLFGSPKPHPNGGWLDLIGDFMFRDDAIQTGTRNLLKNQTIDWFHIVDVVDGKIVFSAGEELPE